MEKNKELIKLAEYHEERGECPPCIHTRWDCPNKDYRKNLTKKMCVNCWLDVLNKDNNNDN